MSALKLRHYSSSGWRGIRGFWLADFLIGDGFAFLFVIIVAALYKPDIFVVELAVSPTISS
jgi:hypothetical protein